MNDQPAKVTTNFQEFSPQQLAAAGYRTGAVAENPRLPDYYADRELPPIDEATATVRLFESEGRFALQGEVAVSALSGGLRVQVAGLHPDVVSLEGTELEVNAQARDLALVGEQLSLGSQLPALGPVTVSARLRDRSGMLEIGDLAIAVGSAEHARATLTGMLGVNVAARLFRTSVPAPVIEPAV